MDSATQGGIAQIFFWGGAGGVIPHTNDYAHKFCKLLKFDKFRIFNFSYIMFVVQFNIGSMNFKKCDKSGLLYHGYRFGIKGT